MLEFDEAVRRRLLQNRKSVDDERLAIAVDMFKDYPRTEGTFKAVAWYGQNGEVAELKKHKQKQREAYQIYMAHCQWRRLEKIRVDHYKALLRCRRAGEGQTIQRYYEKAIQEHESFILRKYKFLDKLPDSIIKQLNANDERKRVDDELLNDPMEKLLSELEAHSVQASIAIY